MGESLAIVLGKLANDKEDLLAKITADVIPMKPKTGAHDGHA